MGKANFSGRSSELEEKFFRQKDQELIRAMREKTATMERKKALAEASGIEHDELLSQLDQLQISAETVAALSLVPLVAVAWADGKLDDKERAAVLAAAEQTGLKNDHPGYRLLESWLQEKPEKGLANVWYDYVSVLCDNLSPEARQQLAQELIGRTRAVAEATGGILGLGRKISASEQAVLDKLAAAFR
ncbi:MAG: tellurite resistance TerB family protein [Thermoguttaceae bacterium]